MKKPYIAGVVVLLSASAIAFALVNTQTANQLSKRNSTQISNVDYVPAMIPVLPSKDDQAAILSVTMPIPQTQHERIAGILKSAEVVQYSKQRLLVGRFAITRPDGSTNDIFLYDTQSDYGVFKREGKFFRFNCPVRELIQSVTNAG